MKIERTSLTIDIDIRTKSLKALKRIYESREELSVLSRYYEVLGGVANAIMDDVLIDIRDSVKKTIKETIIDYQEKEE